MQHSCGGCARLRAARCPSGLRALDAPCTLGAPAGAAAPGRRVGWGAGAPHKRTLPVGRRPSLNMLRARWRTAAQRALKGQVGRAKRRRCVRRRGSVCDRALPAPRTLGGAASSRDERGRGQGQAARGGCGGRGGPTLSSAAWRCIPGHAPMRHVHRPASSRAGGAGGRAPGTALHSRHRAPRTHCAAQRGPRKKQEKTRPRKRASGAPRSRRGRGVAIRQKREPGPGPPRRAPGA